MWCNGKPHTSPEKQRRGRSFLNLGEWKDCYKQIIYWRKLKVWNMVTLHWLSYSSLPLLELLLDKEESFLPPAEVVMQYHFLFKTQGTSLPVGVGSVCLLAHVREFSSSLQTPFEMRFLFINFHIDAMVRKIKCLSLWGLYFHDAHSQYKVRNDLKKNKAGLWLVVTVLGNSGGR